MNRDQRQACKASRLQYNEQSELIKTRLHDLTGFRFDFVSINVLKMRTLDWFEIEILLRFTSSRSINEMIRGTVIFWSLDIYSLS